MNGYTAISKILKKEGVDWIACFPNNPLIEAVAKEGIRPIMFRQERGGIMAADGYSRTMMGKKFGVFAFQTEYLLLILMSVHLLFHQRILLISLNGLNQSMTQTE